MGLKELREGINGIDDKLIRLLAERLKFSEGVGEYKREHGLEVLNEEREAEIIREGIAKLKELGYDAPDFVTKLYETIFEKSRQIQE